MFRFISVKTRGLPFSGARGHSTLLFGLWGKQLHVKYSETKPLIKTSRGYFESRHTIYHSYLPEPPHWPRMRVMGTHVRQEELQLTSNLSRLNESRSLPPRLPKSTGTKTKEEWVTGYNREGDNFHKILFYTCQRLLRVINYFRQNDGEGPDPPAEAHYVFKSAQTESS